MSVVQAHQSTSPDLNFLQVERFSELLSVSARAHKPCNLALGYRSLVLKIANEFIFSSVPDCFRCLVDETFEDPFTLTTAYLVNWGILFLRNFSTLGKLVTMAPPGLISLMTNAFDTGTELINVRVETLYTGPEGVFG